MQPGEKKQPILHNRARCHADCLGLLVFRVTDITTRY